jgi:hypothetical protein
VTKSSESLIRLLKEKGPLTSHQIISKLESFEEGHLSQTAARKRLERAFKQRLIERFLNLGKNQYLYCLPQQYVDAEDIAKCGIRKWSPRLYRLVR